MVNQFACLFRTIFVDDGKCRRVDDIGYSQFFTYSFDERRFTGPHLSIESENGVVSHSCDKLSGSFVDRV